MSKKASKKVEETKEKTEEPKEEKVEEVTAVKEVIQEETASLEPEAEEKIDEAPPPEPKVEGNTVTNTEPVKPVIISDMPTKKPVSPVNFAENDKLVFDWYNGLSGGVKYTIESAAEELGLSVEELDNSLRRLQKQVLPEFLGHLTDWNT